MARGVRESQNPMGCFSRKGFTWRQVVRIEVVGEQRLERASG